MVEKLKKNAKIKKEEKALYEAILSLQNIDECIAFFKDLCTPNEIKAMYDRLLVAKLLKEKNLSYRDIYQKTGISLVTIGRVARFLLHENYGGYELVLKRIKDKNR